MLIIFLFATILSCQNVVGEEKATPKKIIYPRQTHVSFSNIPASANEGNAIRQSVPFVTASPRFLQNEERHFQTTFHQEKSFPHITLETNFTPNVQIQENAVQLRPILHSFKTTQHHNFFTKAPVSFKAPATNIEQIINYEWTIFKQTFNKSYPTLEEERYRREIFIENRNKVSKFNQEYGTGLHSFVQKLNGFADLLHHEFHTMVNGFNKILKARSAPESKSSAFIKSANVGLPHTVDWREIGAVTTVKSQGICGACYAFAAVGALEGQHYRRTGRLVDLSTQNLIDCTVPYTNNGCIGGVIEYAYDYIKDNKGIDTEHFYPFEQRDKLECRYKPEGYGSHVTGYVALDENDEDALESAVATVGPVAVAIDASPDSFQFYSNGVYFEPECKSSVDDLNHAVLVVGYGTEPNGQKYWLIKNSYGPDWGIGGYMKIAKFSNNLCGIATYAIYPLV